MKIKKGDNILIIKGKDRNKKGKVLRGFPAKNRILVEGINMKKVHKRPRREGEKGQVVEIASPIDVSRVKIICPKCGVPTRVGYQTEKDNKVRVCKKCRVEI